MSILVTRPSPTGEQLVSRLRASGRGAWHMPLIDFAPGRELAQLADRLDALHTGDLLFVVSQHAIHYADPYLRRLGRGWPAGLNYYAVGRRSGLLLHSVSGLPVTWPQQGETSEDLLTLPTLQHIDGKRALILRGNGGREVLEQALIARGAQAEYCECYQRSPVHYDGEAQSRRLLDLKIDTLVITSGEMLQQFYTLIPEYYRQHWLMACRLVVVSDRIGSLARQLGWTDIVVANAADNDALMRALL